MVHVTEERGVYYVKQIKPITFAHSNSSHSNTGLHLKPTHVCVCVSAYHQHVIEEKDFALVLSSASFTFVGVNDLKQPTVADKATMRQCQHLEIIQLCNGQ